MSVYCESNNVFEIYKITKNIITKLMIFLDFEK